MGYLQDDRVTVANFVLQCFAAEEWIDAYRTLPEWDEAVERVCWGVVREYA